MQYVNPFVRMRLAQPKELSLYLLKGILFQVGQNEEQFVGERGQRTGVIGTIAATRAGGPSIVRSCMWVTKARSKWRSKA